MALFPIFLKLTGRSVLVVGGGTVATSKVEALRRAGARLTIVAPRVSREIAASGAAIVRRRFRAADVEGRWLVVSAATPAVNRQVARAAGKRQVFVNAVDDPPNATAYLGGVFRRAGVTIAVSTDGHAPAIAGLLREGLESLLPDDLDRWMAIARRERRKWKARGVPMADRRARLLEAINKMYKDRT